MLETVSWDQTELMNSTVAYSTTWNGLELNTQQHVEQWLYTMSWLVAHLMAYGAMDSICGFFTGLLAGSEKLE